MPSVEDNSKAVTSDDEQFSLRQPTDEEHLQPLPDAGAFTPSEQLAAWTKNVQAAEENPGDLDVGAFIKAQSTYIKAQARFMTSGAPPSVDDAYRNIARFSRAQGDFIAAQQAVLEQLRVV